MDNMASNMKLAGLIDKAAELSSELGMLPLAHLIRTQRRILTEKSVFVVFIGPASSGKTSAINSLMGDVAQYGKKREPIIPEGVAPTTAQIIEVSAYGHSYRSSLEYSDSTIDEVSGKRPIFYIMHDMIRPPRRAVIEFPASKKVSRCITLVDTPGFGAWKSETTDGLIEEALGMADTVYLFARASKGISEPMKHIIDKLRLIWNRTGIEQTVSVVLTDTERLPERILELKENLPVMLGININEWIEIPRYGLTNNLLRSLDGIAGQPSFLQQRYEQSKFLLSSFFLPEIKAKLKERLKMSKNYDENLAYLHEAMDRLRQTRDQINRAFDLYYEQAFRASEDLLVDQEASFKISLDGLLKSISLGDRLTPKVYFNELDDISRVILNDEFSKKLSVLSEEHMRSFISKTSDYFEELETIFVMSPDIDIQFSDAFKHRLKIINSGLSRLIGYANRLGGRGGICLGTMNIARKVVSKAYRLFGKRAPADLIRSGIPNSVRPVSKVFKAIGKAWLPVQIGIEILPDVYNAASIKQKLRKQAKKAVRIWHDGESKKNSTAWPGALVVARKVIQEHWLDEEHGLRAQLINIDQRTDEYLSLYNTEIEQIGQFGGMSEEYTHRINVITKALEKLEDGK